MHLIPFGFTTSNHTPIQLNAINTYLRDHKERMGFDEDRKISTHIFQRRVGHTSEKITREIYLHITNKMKSDTKDLLELL